MGVRALFLLCGSSSTIPGVIEGLGIMAALVVALCITDRMHI